MTLYRLGWRHLVRHPWQSLLMVLGITLGVAVVVAVDLANTSARRAFDLSTEAIAGKATHQITGGPNGLDEKIYAQLRRSGTIKTAAPVITDYVSSPQLGNRPLQLLGIDPFSDPPFRNYLGESEQTRSQNLSDAANPAIVNLANFLVRPGAILIAEGLAERYGLRAGETIDLIHAGRRQTTTIADLLKPTDNLSERALDGIILADISTAQELTGRSGKIDHIDLILPADPDLPCTTPSRQAVGCAAAIGASLPADAQLQPVAARQGTVEQMTDAFRVNLTALSLLALVVGMFLIYNTMTFSVVQRRSLFGGLRCLGVTRREIFALVLSEAFIIGSLGALFGLSLGILLGQGAVRLVTQTINDLFFVVTVRGIQIPPESLAKGALLGLAATLLTAAPPAWEAASVPPRLALSRSGLENKAQRAINLAAISGAIAILTGSALLAIPTRSLTLSFAATFAIIIGFALLAPLSTRWMMKFVTPGMGRIWGTMGRMAPRSVVNSLSRTSIAVMALMVAVSVTIGVSLMVASFRYTVATWLGETLQGDIYISTPGLTSTTPLAPIQPDIITHLSNWPGVDRAYSLRAVSVDSPDGQINLSAIDNTQVGQEHIFRTVEAPVETLWERLLNGAVLVSEPLANRLAIPAQNGQITLYTAAGEKTFPIAGIYYDYASTQGAVLMALPVYQKNWQDSAITAMALNLSSGVDLDQTIRQIQDELADQQSLLVRSNRALRQEVLLIFDRTFAITGALQLLATIVAFIGVLSALLSLELERQRELGILRSIGLTVRQLWNLVFLETGLLGAAAGLLAMPTGYVLAIILIYIINRRSFGRTLQMQVTAEPFISALLLAIIAAVLAGLYPARRMGRMVTTEALRSE